VVAVLGCVWLCVCEGSGVICGGKGGATRLVWGRECVCAIAVLCVGR
jgi:hypothetical protein